MTITVASGKGGAGKTSIAAALAASVGSSCIVADCDVDAANGAIALNARLRESSPYFAGLGYRIEPSLCIGCGRCMPACRFNAIRVDESARKYRIVEELCERCGACTDHCPVQAIQSFTKEAGRLLVSDCPLGMTLVHAELVPGEDSSGKLVNQVRRRASAIDPGKAIIIVDAPPGIGCPVIASLSGTDIVLLVVDSTVSGLRDSLRLSELAVGMDKRIIAIINKTGLDEEIDSKIRLAMTQSSIPVMGEVPFDPLLRSVEERGLTWIDVEGEAGQKAKEALRATLEYLQAHMVH
ncbi:MAG: 4Fe-4S binding protein [Spirochaetia bacterium]|jgi:MinD superfamily P-loop ATPase|nr:4Fe-4S binding protein [Spirochaetales bacterium]MDX9784090.1 4Fe-4S binding protein [Spirochaetia bacterium]